MTLEEMEKKLNEIEENYKKEKEKMLKDFEEKLESKEKELEEVKNESKREIKIIFFRKKWCLCPPFVCLCVLKQRKRIMHMGNFCFEMEHLYIDRKRGPCNER